MYYINVSFFLDLHLQWTIAFFPKYLYVTPSRFSPIFGWKAMGFLSKQDLIARERSSSWSKLLAQLLQLQLWQNSPLAKQSQYLEKDVQYICETQSPIRLQSLVMKFELWSLSMALTLCKHLLLTLTFHFMTWLSIKSLFCIVQKIWSNYNGREISMLPNLQYPIPNLQYLLVLFTIL